jgi:DNA replication protein DnaC
LGAGDLELLGIPRRYWARSLSELSEDCEHRDQVLEYAERLEENLRNGRGLLLYGLPGKGKTSVAAAILKKAWAHGAHGRFVSAFDLDEKALTAKRYWDDDAVTMLDKVMDVHLLVLDDVRLTLETAGVRLLARIIRHRTDALRATIVTTNLNEKGLRGLLGEADYEVLRTTSIPILVEGPNWRADES